MKTTHATFRIAPLPAAPAFGASLLVVVVR